jgi:hypothetical protein
MANAPRGYEAIAPIISSRALCPTSQTNVRHLRQGLRLIVAEELKTIDSLKRDKWLATFAAFKTIFINHLRGISLRKPMADIIENCFCIAHI